MSIRDASSEPANTEPQRAQRPAEPLDIAELAERAEVSPRTIRYYEELGLVQPTGRGPGGRRLFGPEALERLRFIGRLKALGLTLEEVGQLNASFERGQTPAMLADLEALLVRRLDELVERRRELSFLEGELRGYLERIRGRLGAAPAGAGEESAGSEPEPAGLGAASADESGAEGREAPVETSESDPARHEAAGQGKG